MKIIGITAQIASGVLLVFACLPAAADPFEDCPSSCDVRTVTEIPGTSEQFIFSKYIVNSYDTCEFSTCCGTTNCSLSTTNTTTMAGTFSTDLNVLTLALPAGFSLGPAGQLKINGSYTVAVAQQSVNGCSFGPCQAVDLEFGASYQLTLRFFDANWSCKRCSPVVACTSLVTCESDGPVRLQEQMLALVDETDIMGTCGTPSSTGCGTGGANPCANPASHTCPS